MGVEVPAIRVTCIRHYQMQVSGERETLPRAAWFARGEPIPRELLRLSKEVDAEDDVAVMGFEDGLSRLSELGLIENGEAGTLLLHRLLADFVRSEASDTAEAQAAVEETLLAEATNINKAGYPAPLLAWRAHLRAVAERAREAGSANAAGLLNEIGYHLKMVADLAGARAAYEKALAIDEATFGPDHPDVATNVNNLGGVLRALGDLTGARAAYERALAIGEAPFGTEHPNTKIIQRNLRSLDRT